MACCWKKGQGWCKSENTIHTDDEGKEYCIFHAPVGVKEKDNKLLQMKFKSILDNPGAGDKCDISGIIIEDDLDFSNKTLPGINLFRAKFHGKVTFFKTTFESSTSFEGAEFYEYTTFYLATFKGKMNFTNANFYDRVTFDEASFHDFANLFEAIFSKNTSFTKTVFRKNVDFSLVKFHRDANFLYASFKGYSDFYNTIFSKQCIFTGAEFNDLGSFYNNLDGGFMFNNITLFDKLRLQGKIIFENINLTEISLLDTEVGKIEFINSQWPNTNEMLLFKRIASYDEIKLKQIINYFKDRDTIHKIETLYRNLKQKAKEGHYEHLASIWHYNEKEMQRLKGGFASRLSPHRLLIWYWLSSGYAERPIRAAIFLIALFVTFALSLNLLTEFPNFDFKNQLLIIAQYVAFEKEPLFKPELFGGHVHKIAARILIPLQATFLALAIRNRFRR